MRSSLARKFRAALETLAGSARKAIHPAVRRAATCSVEMLESRQMLSTYFVSPSGSDGSSGTSINAPWKSINRVNRQNLKPGDKILFKGNNNYSGGLVISSGEGGSSKNPILVSSYGNGRATINSGGKAGIEVAQTAGVSVSNLNFRGSGARANKASGIWFHVEKGNKSLNFVRVDNVDVSGYGGYNVKIQAKGKGSSYSDIRITNGNLHDSTEGGIWINGPANRVNKNVYIADVKAYNHSGNGRMDKVTGSGIFVADTDGAIIERCVTYNNGVNGKAPVGIWSAGSSRITIQYCESYGNKTKTTTDGGGFDFDWDVTNSVMQYNYSHDNYGPGYLICGDNHKSEGNTIRYNISQNDGRRNGRGGIHLFGNAKNVKIHNNVVYMSSTGNRDTAAFTALTGGGTKMSNVDVRNNVFYTTGGAKLLRITSSFSGNGSNRFAGNAYYSAGSAFKIDWSGRNYGSLDSWRSAKGQERQNGASTGFSGDPKLNAAGKAPTLNDAHKLNTLTHYKPKKDSKLINKGVSLNTTLSSGTKDFFGSSLPKSGKYDIGVNEEG